MTGMSDKPGVDMSSDALMKRLREVSGLFLLYQVLKKAKRIGPVEENPPSRPLSPHSPE